MSDLPFPGFKEVVKEEMPYTPKKQTPQSKPKSHAYYMLIILIIGLLGYVGYIEYTDYMVEYDNKIMEQGVQFGYEQTILQIIEKSLTCEPVSLIVNNETINLINIECLTLGEQNG